MASFQFLALSIILIASSTLSIPSNELNLETPTISAAPALLPNPPISPYTELSPEIAPLFPSPGGTTSSPAGSSMPTIPSTRTPNPDAETASIGPDTAFAPSGSLQDSSALSQILVKGSKVEFFSAFSIMMVFMI